MVKLGARQNVLTWWKSNAKLAQDPLFLEIMLRLHSSCPHACSVERVNKAHKLIHTTVRSRLGNSVVRMLLYSYVNMRLLKRDVDPFVPMIESAIMEEDGSLPEGNIDIEAADAEEGDLLDEEEHLEDQMMHDLQVEFIGIPNLNLPPP